MEEAVEEVDVDEVTMAGWMKVGHFWPVTVLAQFLTGPYVSNIRARVYSEMQSIKHNRHHPTVLFREV